MIPYESVCVCSVIMWCVTASDGESPSAAREGGTMGGGEGNRNSDVKILLFIFYMDENLLADLLFSKNQV